MGGLPCRQEVRTTRLHQPGRPAPMRSFMVLYALHDGMVKAMPGTLQAPCLAESWQMSEDGTTWDFTIRASAKFHNGAPVTAEDVKFSFARYRGANQGE